MILFCGIPNDLDEGVAARLERQRVLHQGDRKFSFVIAEQALRTTVGDSATMVGQMEHLLSAMASPRIVIGIVPRQARLYGAAINGFVMYDNRLVLVETVSAELTINQPREIGLYSKLFAMLSDQACYGDAGRALIRKAIDDHL
ncbi:DUF5753 domain-containing protein [Nocardia sp. NPDC055321]